MSEGNELFSIGNFLVLVVSGAIIPLLLVLYKSRCESICWGCIKRDVLPPDEKKPSLAEANKKVKEENIRESIDGETSNNEQNEIQQEARTT
tara:strand:+ start:2433 stop:2708 length:276 start_codon:yes stop_codon:yes gene_type:complete